MPTFFVWGVGKATPRAKGVMAAADVVEQVRTIATRVAASYGLEIFDVSYRREGSGMVLRIQIDRPGPAATAEESVGVAECADISRDLSAILDVDDVVSGSYTLEVSSPGLDRPLIRPDDYQRFAGRFAKVVMREPVDGQKYFKGRLGGVESGYVVIEGEDHRTHRVPLDVIARANLEVEF
jgi:ribosome maturation factor RimP